MTTLANPVRAELTDLFELSLQAAVQEAEKDGSINGHKHTVIGTAKVYLPNGRLADLTLYSTHALLVWVLRQGRKLVGSGEAKWTKNDEVKITSALMEPEYQGFGIYATVIKILGQLLEEPIVSDSRLTSPAERAWKRIATKTRGSGAVRVYVYETKAIR